MMNNQGQAVEKTAIYLEMPEATGGLIFVLSTRTKRLVYLLVKPIPYFKVYVHEQEQEHPKSTIATDEQRLFFSAVTVSIYSPRSRMKDGERVEWINGSKQQRTSAHNVNVHQLARAIIPFNSSLQEAISLKGRRRLDGRG